MAFKKLEFIRQNDICIRKVFCFAAYGAKSPECRADKISR